VHFWKGRGWGLKQVMQGSSENIRSLEVYPEGKMGNNVNILVITRFTLKKDYNGSWESFFFFLWGAGKACIGKTLRKGDSRNSCMVY
jgi:hypothetical protein